MNYLKEIKILVEKDIVTNKKYELYRNQSLVNTYFEIGKLLVLAQGGKERAKYGEGLIKKWSHELTQLYGTNFNYTNLVRMRQFYIIFEKLAPVRQQLSWTNIKTLISIKEENKRNYYINMCIKHNLSSRQLIEFIKSNSFERLSYADKENIKILLKEDKINVKDTLKNPIYIQVDKDISRFNEKILKSHIIDRLEKFFIELGVGYTFVGSEYKLGDRFCDLLLFNYELLCFVVIELKVRKLYPSDLGQIEYYMKYIDENIKKPIFNNTIGIIVTKEDNILVMSYCSNSNIYETTYKLVNK